MLGFFNRFIKDKNHCRKDCYTAKHSNDNTFCHNNTKITTKCKCHNTKSYKSCYCGDRTSYNGFECIRNRMSHRTVLISRETALVLFVAIQQENGVIHRNTQLQHGGQCFGDVADLAQQDVGAEVVRDGEQQPQHEQQRGDGAFQREEQHQQAGTHGDQDVERHFLVDQQRFDLADGVHRLVAGAGCVEADDEHGGIVLAEHELLHVGGQHLGGDAGIDHIAEPEGLGNAGHGFYLLFHGDQFVCG